MVVRTNWIVVVVNEIPTIQIVNVAIAIVINAVQAFR